MYCNCNMVNLQCRLVKIKKQNNKPLHNANKHTNIKVYITKKFYIFRQSQFQNIIIVSLIATLKKIFVLINNSHSHVSKIAGHQLKYDIIARMCR